jgi:hypothetical protein
MADDTKAATRIAFAGVGCTIALAACGASAPPGAATTTNASVDTSGHYSTQLKFSECMRKHGVPNLPDPTFGPSGGITQGVGPGANSQSPAYEHALAVCGGA